MKKLLLAAISLLATQAAIAQCSPGFTWTAAPSGSNLLNVNFTNTSTFTTPPVNALPQYTWKWGDGQQTNNWGGNPSHNYAAPGTYTVKLIMSRYDSLTQALICQDSVAQSITIAYPPCGSTFSNVNNSANNGQVTFTASTPSGVPVTYSWNFGDATTGSGSPVSHTYATTGTYIVTLTATAGAPYNCTYTYSKTINVTNLTTINCAGHTASFTKSVSFNTVSVNNTSPNFAGQSRRANWYWGDGNSTMNVNNTSHAYATPGTYTIWMVAKWTDSMNTVTYCMDSTSQVVTVGAAQNIISGYVSYDSLNLNPTWTQIRVWLIDYDAQTSMLTAVDSVTVTANTVTPYSFLNKPAGSYRTKAAILYGSTIPASGPVPAYHQTSLYWSTATVINHTGGVSSSKHIYMPTGVPTSGPGFVGGNVNMGANKGTGTTGAAVPGIEIILRDANGNPVQHAYTDANGDYSFSNVPLGTYSIYPEEMNYQGIPFTNVTLTAAAPSVTNKIFGMTATAIGPKGSALSVGNVAANDFKVYPNPADNKVSILWSVVPDNAQVTISDVSGKVVYNGTLEVSGFRSELNVAQLQSGMYFIRINADNAQQSQKLVIQH